MAFTIYTTPFVSVYPTDVFVLDSIENPKTTNGGSVFCHLFPVPINVIYFFM